MTQIVWEDHTGNVHITLRGHAEFAQQGESDIVCAGISMLVCTLSACLEQQEERGVVRLLCRKIEPGDVEFRIEILSRTKEVRAMLETIRTGFLLLANTYPENVRMHIE